MRARTAWSWTGARRLRTVATRASCALTLPAETLAGACPGWQRSQRRVCLGMGASRLMSAVSRTTCVCTLKAKSSEHACPGCHECPDLFDICSSCTYTELYLLTIFKNLRNNTYLMLH